MLSYVKQFLRFWYRFIFGDDLIAASLVIAGFIATYFIARSTSARPFWLLPAVVLLSLSVSLFRRARSASKER